MSGSSAARGKARRRLALGLALVALAWPANWFLPGLRTHVLFFPLWLGYVLTLDAWTELRDGSSAWSRAPRAFLLWFALSVPLWWLFELANEHLGNWEYLGRERFGDLEYALLGSLSFSTVVPAVLVSAQWARGCAWIERLARGPRVSVRGAGLVGLLAFGLALLAALVLWPRYCYALLWVGGVFVLEPIARWCGRRSLLTDLERGDWRPWIALWVGSLVCGFFWELWNVRSYPKWIYHVPFVDEPKLFEMPLLGYLGYLPFALEVYLWKELWLREPELLR